VFERPYRARGRRRHSAQRNGPARGRAEAGLVLRQSYQRGAFDDSAFPGSAEFSKNEAVKVSGVSQYPSLTQCLGPFGARWHYPRFIQCGLGLGVEVDILMWPFSSRHPKNVVQFRFFVCPITDSGNVFGDCKKITFGKSQKAKLCFRAIRPRLIARPACGREVRCNGDSGHGDLGHGAGLAIAYCPGPRLNARMPEFTRR
jgi:hypothetical protein